MSEDETPAEPMELAAEDEAVASEAPVGEQPAEVPVAEASAEPAAAEGEAPAAEAAADEGGTADAGAAGGEGGTEAEPGAVSGPTQKRKRLPRSQRRRRAKPKRDTPAERKPIVRLPKPEHPRGRRQERQGTVVSAAADKTIVVRVDVVKLHPVYKKVIRRSTKLHAHDERNEAKVGDVVRIVETRPLSKLKRWHLREIVEAAK